MSATYRASTASRIRAAAMRLFDEHGFDATTIDDIADSAGIARRTFYSHYESKNDVPFEDMDETMRSMDAWLSALPAEFPLLDALATALAVFNTVSEDGKSAHRQRMELVLRTPALQAHRTVRVSQFEDVIARFVAGRLNEPVDGLIPRFLAHVCMAAELAAYDVWLDDPDADLADLLRRPFALLQLPGSGKNRSNPSRPASAATAGLSESDGDRRPRRSRAR